MYEYEATLERVVDGDTIVLMIDLGFETYERKTVRLARINAPEMSTDAGKAAKAYLVGLLGPDEVLTVRTIKDRKEKYGRYLVEVIGSHGNVNDAMLMAGHAVEYSAK